MDEYRNNCFEHWLAKGVDDERAGFMADVQAKLMSSVASLVERIFVDIMLPKLEDLPIELMPSLLSFLQRGEAIDDTRFNSLDLVFRVVRDFNTTLVSSVVMNSGPSIVEDTTDHD